MSERGRGFIKTNGLLPLNRRSLVRAFRVRASFVAVAFSSIFTFHALAYILTEIISARPHDRHFEISFLHRPHG